MDDSLLTDDSLARQVLDAAVEGVLIADVATKEFRYANAAIGAMFGYPPDAMLGLRVADIHPPDDLDEVFAAFAAQVRGEMRVMHGLPCLRRDGSVFWADVKAATITIDGTPCSVGFFTDVTERRAAEAEIHASQELLRSIFDAVPDLLLVIDRSFQIIYTNFKGHDQIAQPDPDKARTCFGRFKLLDEPCADCSAHPVFTTGETVEQEMVNPADGGTREVRAFPIRNAAGEVEYVVEYVRDITERKRAEADRIRLELQAPRNQKLESLGLLAGGIAHDFNNLLTAIYGNLDLALSRVRDPVASDLLAATSRTMDRAADLTHQLLTFAKGGAPERRTASLVDFLRKTAEFVLSGSTVSLECDIPADLWSCDYNQNQIGQVIDNLIINAQQAMPEGGRLILQAENRHLAADSHPELVPGDYIAVAIIDTGHGIPPDRLETIFDPFFTTRPEGHGLGLATSHSIVRRHGGTIDVASTVGKGSTFTVLLPAAIEGEPDG